MSITENRFLDADLELDLGHPAAPGIAGALSWAGALSATDRVLVVLIENGGVDLGIPDLVDALLRQLPGADILPDSAREALTRAIRDELRRVTDDLLEGAELALNRYNAAKPDLFGDIVVLRNSTATYAELKRTLAGLTRAGKVVDVLILTHGGTGVISVESGITADMIRAMRADAGGALSVRAVYMMNCEGSSLNQAWIDAGARAASGSAHTNFLPEPTTFFFWRNWRAGQGFEQAVTGAFRQTIDTINGAVRAFVTALPVPGSSLLASRIDVGSMDFARQSAPMVQGDGTVTISTDALPAAQSTGQSLATTVLHVGALQSLAADAAAPGPPPRHVLSQRVVDLVKGFEPFQARKHEDWGGNCAIGYGTVLHPGACDGRPVEPEQVDEARATELLRAQLTAAQQAVDEAVSVPLTQNQNDALVSFVSDVGEGAFRSSTLLDRLNGGDAAATAAELRKWTNGRCGGQVVEVPELVRRRAAEAELFERRGEATAASMGAVNYAVPGAITPVRQPSPRTCWATVIAMMRSWREQRSMEPRVAIAPGGQRFLDLYDRDQVLPPDVAGELYEALGLVAIRSFNPTIEAWEDMLRRYGPLYVDIGYPAQTSTHAVIVTAISGDGTADGTTITYVDPAEGRTITQRFAQFLADYEAPSAVTMWPYVITHWPAGLPSAATQSLPVRQSTSYEASVAPPALSQAQFAIAGIAIADAIQIGLGGVAIAQAAVSGSQGAFTLTYDKAQRLLTTDARIAMPGAQAAKHAYSRPLFFLNPNRSGEANAHVIIEWEGNAYGEIGTPVIRRELSTSTEWTHSSATIAITKLDRIPPANTDPRTWPVIYSYEGTYDPIGNGYFEFTGEFEINAFGGIRWTRHQAVSRSAIEFLISHGPDFYVQRGADAVVPVPDIPAEQVQYLRAHPAG